MHLFGKAKPAAPSPSDAISKLKDSEMMLSKRQAFLQTKIDAEMAQIKKKLAVKDKKGALTCMKRKKLYESSCDQLEKMTINIQTQIITLEGATVNVEAFQANKMFTEGMKQIHGNLTVDKVEEQLQDAQEQMDVQKEITDALSSQLSAETADDDELLAELEELEQEDMDEKLAHVTLANTTPLLPDAPIGDPTLAPAAAAAMTDEERELAELEASMIEPSRGLSRRAVTWAVSWTRSAYTESRPRLDGCAASFM
eukprot:CAMPEP_0181316286 /NCGR_PEP_ID=MMETSP1101-20121128/15814_1 /TAXON_ID=46948 /ORGANISM="Rhodomonas abbreviata, Strain Caron Lab Isolate" /LENGTH=254 /DNA_ID=CAMNT_0023423523 /DNA_START=255 /DNA_END=1020 /DNA_ORIENTATION=-